MIKKLNSLALGIVLGGIIPTIIFIIIYITKFSALMHVEIPLRDILGNLLPVLLSWCIIPDLLLFFVFNWLDWLKAAKGVLISTVTLTVLLFAFKFFYNL